MANKDKIFWKNVMKGTQIMTPIDLNIKEPIIKVKAKQFKNCKMDCKVCGEGVVKPARDTRTMKILKRCNCYLCGQPYEIEEYKTL
jgi:hypothetical protein